MTQLPMDPAVCEVLQRALNGERLSRENCLMLLRQPEKSAQASFIRAAGDAVSRWKFGGAAMLLGQIGIEAGPCPGGCAFCTFREEAHAEPWAEMDPGEVCERADIFMGQGGVAALFLMGMHTFRFDYFLELARMLRARLPATTQVVVNVGDLDVVQAVELKAAGVGGAYHVLRLREGVDTALQPADRQRTIEAIREAGLDWYTCCEPIGPEHTNEEVLDSIFLGIDMGCYQHAAMRRVALPGSPLSGHGQISELRLGQITAVIALATAGCPGVESIAVHEPNPIGIASGANSIYAESGCNPRDGARDTSVGRGRDVQQCRTMLEEAGYGLLRMADGSTVMNQSLNT